MPRSVSTIELGLYERMVPLLGGYLEARATTDPFLAKEYRFDKRAWTVRTPRREIVDSLLATDSTVYAFSCYVWNVRLVQAVVADLLAARPTAEIMLGGPQIMNNAERYLRPEWERVTICNGEGEEVFADYLRELTTERPELSRVAGLTLFRDGTAVETAKRDRIRELDGVPSPFLGNLFSGDYGFTVFETNRGCPFRCGFCYWGAATNDRVFRFSEERIRDELTWISKKGILFIYIADANWGMHRRDVEYSRHIAECARSNHVPRMVYFSAAKNSPDRVTEIAEIFGGAGIMSSQPVSLQTIDERTLAAVDRENIKRSAYGTLQKRLNQLGISSYSELIWPLPAETLSSFKGGIDAITADGCPTIVVYPHILLMNTPLHRRRAELGFGLKSIYGDVGDAEIVVSTPTVTEAEFETGMRVFYGLHILYNVRGLWGVGRYLASRNLLKISELSMQFSEWLARDQSSPVSTIIERSVRNALFDIADYGAIVHSALHENRGEMDRLIYEFIRSQAHWNMPEVRFLYEMDRACRPYVYSSAPPGAEFDEGWPVLRRRTVGERVWEIDVPEEFQPLMTQYCGAEGGATYVIDHNREQFPFVPGQDLVHNADYCHGMTIRLRELLPGIKGSRSESPRWKNEQSRSSATAGPIL